MTLRIWLGSLVILLCVPLAQAHGSSAALQAELANGYMVDIDYNRLGIRPNEEITFKFNIYTVAANPVALAYDHVEVYVSDDKKTLVKGYIPYDQNKDGWKYTFPKDGRYTMQANFIFGDQQSVTRSFVIKAQGYNGFADRLLQNIHFIIAAVLGIFTLVVIAHALKKNPDGVEKDDLSGEDLTDDR